MMRKLIFVLCLITVPLFAQKGEEEAVEHNAGMVPSDSVVIGGSNPTPTGGLESVPAVGVETQTGAYYNFMTGSCESMTNIGTVPDIANFPGAGDHASDLNIYYMGNNTGALFEFNLTTGVSTMVGVGTNPGGQTYSGFAWDPTTSTMYASNTDVTASTLSTLNLSNGALTTVGTITGAPCAIALAADPITGILYTYDICSDTLHTVNKVTGAGSTVGPIGFDANFGQGMDFDDSTGTLYMAAFNGTSFAAELRTVNIATGATNLECVLGSTSPGGLLQMASMGVTTSGCTITQMSLDADVSAGTGLLTIYGNCNNFDVWCEDQSGNLILVASGVSVNGSTTIEIDVHPDSIYFAADPAMSPPAPLDGITTVRTVPTLGEYGLFAFVLLLAGAAVFFMRRRATA
jgi:hypothetical protein